MGNIYIRVKGMGCKVDIGFNWLEIASTGGH
jgi:hypothetical protein